MISRNECCPNIPTRLPVVDLRHLQSHDGSWHHRWQVGSKIRAVSSTRSTLSLFPCRNTLVAGRWPYAIDVHDHELDSIFHSYSPVPLSLPPAGCKTIRIVGCTVVSATFVGLLMEVQCFCSSAGSVVLFGADSNWDEHQVNSLELHGI